MDISWQRRPPCRIAYIYSPALVRAADRLPSNRGRSTLSHALVAAFGLLSDPHAPSPHPAGRSGDDNPAVADEEPKVASDNETAGCSIAAEPSARADGDAVPLSEKSACVAETEIVLVPSRRAVAADLEACHDRSFIEALLDDAANAAADDGVDGFEPDLASPSTLRHTEGAPVVAESRGVKRKRGRHEHATASDTDASEDDAEEQDKFGLEYDCPRFAGLTDYVLEVCGGSLTAARCLLPPAFDTSASGRAAFDVAIHVDGGRHHAGRCRASGFCYANDCNLAISLLRHALPGSPGAGELTAQRRVMYIDLDLHHGDGVERCFRHSDAVLCLSVHRFDRGFFPNRGALAERGVGRGNGYTINVPTRRGLSNASLARIVAEVIVPAMDRYRPAAVVVQCGADGLHGDPHAEWNLSIRGLCNAVRSIDEKAADMGCSRLYLGGKRIPTHNAVCGNADRSITQAAATICHSERASTQRSWRRSRGEDCRTRFQSIDTGVGYPSTRSKTAA